MDGETISAVSAGTSAFAAIAILFLSIVQFFEVKSLNKTQKRLARLDLLPSVDLQFDNELGTLLIKNTGRMQFFFEAAVVNKVEPSFSSTQPDGKRLIPLGGGFPIKI